MTPQESKREGSPQFLFRSVFLSSQLKVERVGAMCASQEAKNKNSGVGVVLCFCCSRNNKTHMHVLGTKHKLYNFGDSAYELNVLIFTSKTVLHSNKMNSKIPANNLNFVLCYLE